MQKNNYLITLVRKNGSREVYVPSLEREENAGCMTSSEFVEKTLSALGPEELEVDFISQPNKFGIVAVTCTLKTAELLQRDPQVASVLNIHESCTSDPWDLLPILKDDNTRRAFAELRNERRFQKDVESAWSSTNRSNLRDLCGDFIDLDTTYRTYFNLPELGAYLGMSVTEFSKFMIISPALLGDQFPSAHTPDNVINRARSLVLIALMLRKIFGPSARATDWMLRKQAEGWHHNGLSAKDCLINGYYSQVFQHLAEITRRPDRPICGGIHRCSHDFFGASRHF